MTFDGQPFYGSHPHFTVGDVNQWGERGYFLFEGKIYSYEDDRKSGYYVATPLQHSVEDFIAMCAEDEVEIPTTFLQALKE